MLSALFLSLTLVVQASSSSSLLSPSVGHIMTEIPTYDALELLDGSWVLIAGDSQCRRLVLSLLRLLMDPATYEATKADMKANFKKRRYQVDIPGANIKVDFRFSPWEQNVTSLLRSLNGLPHPDVVITGTGLWHLSQVTDPASYGKNLREIKRAVERDEDFISSSRLFWLGMPMLVAEKNEDEEKRAKMNSMMVEKYGAEVDGSRILSRDGGPFLLLDLGAVSRECVPACCLDGVHYVEPVYDEVVQLMLNMLLADRRAKMF